jgi:hypothetical protein
MSSPISDEGAQTSVEKYFLTSAITYVVEHTWWNVYINNKLIRRLMKYFKIIPWVAKFVNNC